VLRSACLPLPATTAAAGLGRARGALEVCVVPAAARPGIWPGARVGTGGLSRVRGTASAMSTALMTTGPGPCAPPAAPGSWPPSAA